MLIETDPFGVKNPLHYRVIPDKLAGLPKTCCQESGLQQKRYQKSKLEIKKTKQTNYCNILLVTFKMTDLLYDLDTTGLLAE